MDKDDSKKSTDNSKMSTEQSVGMGEEEDVYDSFSEQLASQEKMLATLGGPKEAETLASPDDPRRIRKRLESGTGPRPRPEKMVPRVALGEGLGSGKPVKEEEAFDFEGAAAAGVDVFGGGRKKSRKSRRKKSRKSRKSKRRKRNSKKKKTYKRRR